MSLFVLAAVAGTAWGDDRQVLFKDLRHLRNAEPREWSEFPEQAKGTHLEVRFSGRANPAPATLTLRQQDVKQGWNVILNGKPLGRLAVDERDLIAAFEVPAGGLVEGENTLRIEAASRTRPVADDIRVGEVELVSSPKNVALNESVLSIEVLDSDTQQRLPARITITRDDGPLPSLGIASDGRLAVRQGTVYTADGTARIGLPAGTYTIHAGRGFEYSLASQTVTLKSGESLSRRLTISREVATPGLVACDTHVHTLTHSGHGDATVQERMVTLAAEGIELPVATDHNVHVDHGPFAEETHVRRYFTPVVGNEVTTPVGHFNVFPVTGNPPVPDFTSTDWQELITGIQRVPGVRAVILNHARDVHRNVRPFGPKNFNAASGERLDGKPLRVNAMEVVNSSATQTDGMQLLRDWMAVLNRGTFLTPVGSSDSHDVVRHFVGQARTYIRCDDRDPGNIDVEQAVNSFVQGRVLVSYGLLTEIRVNEKFGPGDLASTPDETVRVSVRVLGPHWVTARRVTLFANGRPIQEADVPPDRPDSLPTGVKWQGEWVLPSPKHDQHLVAIAVGPGIDGPYWKTAKPYQPVSPDWTPYVIGATGAVWLDADRDGRPTPARDYAREIVHECRDSFSELVNRLGEFDASVAIQAVSAVQARGKMPPLAEAETVLKSAAPAVREGFREYFAAWRECEMAKASGTP